MPFCDTCQTEADHDRSTETMRVRSCDCGKFQLVRLTDPADRIREQLEEAERRNPRNGFVESLRSQFQSRGTLSPAQLDGLARLAGAATK